MDAPDVDASDVEAVGVEQDGTGSSVLSCFSFSSLPNRTSSLFSDDTGSALEEGVGAVVSADGVSVLVLFPCTSICTL